MPLSWAVRPFVMPAQIGLVICAEHIQLGSSIFHVSWMWFDPHDDGHVVLVLVLPGALHWIVRARKVDPACVVHRNFVIPQDFLYLMPFPLIEQLINFRIKEVNERVDEVPYFVALKSKMFSFTLVSAKSRD